MTFQLHPNAWDDTLLPFDKIDKFKVSFDGNKSPEMQRIEAWMQGNNSAKLLEKLEEYQPMLAMYLDLAGISIAEVKQAMKERHKSGNDWQDFKDSVTYVTGKSWAEIAPIESCEH